LPSNSYSIGAADWFLLFALNARKISLFLNLFSTIMLKVTANSFSTSSWYASLIVIFLGVKSIVSIFSI
jgi:hypothetical protein